MRNLRWIVAVTVLILLAACSEGDDGGTVNPPPDANNPPTIDSFEVSENSGAAPLSVTFSWAISDADDDTLSCTVDSGNDSAETVETCTSSSTQDYTYSSEGTYTARLTVSDAEGEVSEELQVAVSENDDGDDGDGGDGGDDGDTNPPPPCGSTDNSTFETACTLTLGETRPATVDADGDIDYYRFTTTAPGVATALVASLPDNIFFEIKLYNADKEEIGSSNSTGDAVGFPVLTDPATFYLSVEGRQASSDPYEVGVTFDDSDEYELNNSDDNPTPIALDQVVQGDINGYVYTTENRDPLDQDFFVYDTTETGVAEVILSSVPTGSNLTIRVLDAAKQEIRQDAVVSAGQTGQFFILSEPGKFYIEVGGAFGSSAGNTEPYELRVNFTQDDAELNNSEPTATPINIGESVEGAIYGLDLANNLDVDFYTFTSSQAGRVVLSSVPAGVSMQIAVTDTASPAQPVCQDLSVRSGQTGDCPFPGAGTYIVRINSNNSNPERYALNVTSN